MHLAMTLEEAENWDGCDYDAIVVVGTWEDSTVKEVCRGTGMTAHALLNKPHTNTYELQKATALLNAVLWGMANLLSEKSGPTRPEASKKWEKMKQDLIAPRGPKQLKGARLDDNRLQNKPAFKCAFKQDVHHPPDPILLAAKAALNWAK